MSLPAKIQGLKGKARERRQKSGLCSKQTRLGSVQAQEALQFSAEAMDSKEEENS